MRQKHVLQITLISAALLVTACACPDVKPVPDTASAPKHGDVVLSRDMLYPVRVKYVHLPYIDAGAVLQIDADQHVLTRNLPYDRAYTHTWMLNDGRARAKPPPHVVLSQQRPAAPRQLMQPPRPKPGDLEARDVSPVESAATRDNYEASSRPTPPPRPSAGEVREVSQGETETRPPSPSIPVVKTGNQAPPRKYAPPAEHYCDDDEEPEQTGCIYPK